MIFDDSTTLVSMKLDHHYYVYIVQCKDGSYYTGVTNNGEKVMGT
jgi:predicted GIY-YIG superfamily endonuclease